MKKVIRRAEKALRHGAIFKEIIEVEDPSIIEEGAEEEAVECEYFDETVEVDNG